MNRIIKLTIILTSGIILSGCLKTVEQLGWGNFDKPQPSPEAAQPTPDASEDLGVLRARQIGIPACDTYLNYMVCTTAELNSTTAEQIMEDITKDWPQTDTDTLTAKCTQMVKEIQESPQQYAGGVDCKI